MNTRKSGISGFKKLPATVAANLLFKPKMRTSVDLALLQNFMKEGTSKIPVKVIGFTDLQHGRCTKFFPCHPTDQPKMIGHVLLDYLEVVDPTTPAAIILLQRR